MQNIMPVSRGLAGDFAQTASQNHWGGQNGGNQFFRKRLTRHPGHVQLRNYAGAAGLDVNRSALNLLDGCEGLPRPYHNPYQTIVGAGGRGEGAQIRSSITAPSPVPIKPGRTLWKPRHRVGEEVPERPASRLATQDAKTKKLTTCVEVFLLVSFSNHEGVPPPRKQPHGLFPASGSRA